MATSKINLIKNVRTRQQSLANGMTVRMSETNECYIVQCDGTPTSTDEIVSFPINDVFYSGPNFLAPLINYGASGIFGRLTLNGGYIKVKANQTDTYLCGCFVLPKI